MNQTSSRSQRERESADSHLIYQNSDQLHRSFSHVFESPNTIRCEKLLKDELSSHIPSKKVLDIGCGSGGSSIELLKYHPQYVMGIDISERFINQATKSEKKNYLEFALKDISLPIEGKFDVIFGRAILHHFCWQKIFIRLELR